MSFSGSVLHVGVFFFCNPNVLLLMLGWFPQFESDSVCLFSFLIACFGFTFLKLNCRLAASPGRVREISATSLPQYPLTLTPDGSRLKYQFI